MSYDVGNLQTSPLPHACQPPYTSLRWTSHYWIRVSEQSQGCEAQWSATKMAYGSCTWRAEGRYDTSDCGLRLLIRLQQQILKKDKHILYFQIIFVLKNPQNYRKLYLSFLNNNNKIANAINIIQSISSLRHTTYVIPAYLVVPRTDTLLGYAVQIWICLATV